MDNLKLRAWAVTYEWRASMATFLRGRVLIRTILACFSLAIFIAACASLPPAKAVTSVSQIAGKWQGIGSSAYGSSPVTQAINPDGSYTAILASGPRAGSYTGKITLVDGKLRGKGDQTGATGTYSLHEGEGQRVVVYKSDDGAVASELKPVK
jgi:hypothetical protein